MATKEEVQSDLLGRIEELRSLVLSGQMRALSYAYVAENGMQWGHSSYEGPSDAMYMIALLDACKNDLSNHVLPCRCITRPPASTVGATRDVVFASSNGRGGAGT